MNEQQPGSPPPTIKLGDILYVIFRHKWKILIISGLGIIATFLVPFFAPRMYQSEAKLLIKYVLESKSARQIASNNDSQMQRVDSQGESIINTELQVLSSLDLARDVARVMTPERILAKSGGGTNLEAAAALIRANIQTEVPKGSSVIRILFQHPDRTLVQPVLQQIIASYLTKHAESTAAAAGSTGFWTRKPLLFTRALSRPRRGCWMRSRRPISFPWTTAKRPMPTRWQRYDRRFWMRRLS